MSETKGHKVNEMVSLSGVSHWYGGMGESPLYTFTGPTGIEYNWYSDNSAFIGRAGIQVILTAFSYGEDNRLRRVSLNGISGRYAAIRNGEVFDYRPRKN